MINTTDQKIIDWAYDRGIMDNAKPKDQFVKTVEEVGELAQAISHNNFDEIVDAVGDIQVTLIILCAIYGIDYELTKEKAYEIISKRTGTMKNGVFVKDD